MKPTKQLFKHLIFYLFIILNIQYTYAQEIEKKPLDSVENTENKTPKSIKKAVYSKGMKRFNSELTSKFNQPQNIIEKQISTVIQFTIEVDGTTSEFETLKYDSYGIGAQVIEIIKNMSTWIPAEQDGQKVKSKFVVPFTIYGEKKNK